VSALASGQNEPREIMPGKYLGPNQAVKRIVPFVKDWKFEAVSVGISGAANGWDRLDFARVFGKPTKVVSDIVLQALGSYRGGRLLFLRLGAKLDSVLIADHVIVPLDLGGLLYRNWELSQVLGTEGRKEWGLETWQRTLAEMVVSLRRACLADEVVLGGNVRRLEPVPADARLCEDKDAFEGGFRLWERSGNCVVDGDAWRLVN
jgi:polyphosphate glucokinase